MLPLKSECCGQRGSRFSLMGRIIRVVAVASVAQMYDPGEVWLLHEARECDPKLARRRVIVYGAWFKATLMVDRSEMGALLASQEPPWKY